MGKRILIIDDDRDILAILSLVLEEAGYVVIGSESGAAIDNLETIKPDLILLDIRINGYPKSGTEICTELKSHMSFREIPVILISAESEIHILARDCAADAYIRKPFDIYELIDFLKDFIDKNRQNLQKGDSSPVK